MTALPCTMPAMALAQTAYGKETVRMMYLVCIIHYKIENMPPSLPLLIPLAEAALR